MPALYAAPRHHGCLRFAPLGKDAWTLTGTRGSVFVPMARHVMVNDGRVVRALALTGEGAALLPLDLCRADCAKARLARVLPGWHARVDPVQIGYPRQPLVSPRLRAFVDLTSLEMCKWLEAS